MEIKKRKKVEVETKGELFKFTLVGESLQCFCGVVKEMVTRYGVTETLEVVGVDGKKYFII